LLVTRSYCKPPLVECAICFTIQSEQPSFDSPYCRHYAAQKSNSGHGHCVPRSQPEFLFQGDLSLGRDSLRLEQRTKAVSKWSRKRKERRSFGIIREHSGAFRSIQEQSKAVEMVPNGTDGVVMARCSYVWGSAGGTLWRL
jgi:hypothetical protein